MADDIVKILEDLTGFDPSPFSLVSKAGILIHRQRLLEGGEILRRRMAKGRPWMFREDKVASLTFDFLRAAEDGAAQMNLEIMAELIANGVAEPGLTEADVRHLMRVVRDLSYDEMRAVATLLRAQQAFAPPPDLNEEPTKYWSVAQVYDLAWRELAGAAHADEEPPDWVVGTYGALMRTGLLYTDSAWEGMKYAGTPMLARLAGLVDFGSFPQTQR